MSLPPSTVPQPPPQASYPPVQASPPRPERPLRPAVVWSVLINVVVGSLAAVAIVLLGSVFLAVVPEASMQPAGAEVGLLVGFVALLTLAAVLVGAALTVGALMLLRLIGGYRALAPFLQGLLAWLAACVVGTVVGPVLSFVLQLLAVPFFALPLG